MQTYFVTRVGINGNKRRIWLQGSRLDVAGFEPAKRYSVDIDREARRVTLRLAPLGERQVSRKEQSGKILPLVELTKADVISVFEGIDRLRVIFEDGAVHILPLASEARKAERIARVSEKLAKGEPLNIGSVSTGVGALAQAMHEGFKEGGIETRLAFACDIEPVYLEQCAAQNPVWCKDTVMVAAPMQEIAFDPWALRRLPSTDWIEIGIPCTAHSVSARAKKDQEKPEDDPDVGHLVVAALAFVAALNPIGFTLENVVPYLSSASFSILKNQLTEWGYVVHTDILRGEDFNELEHRDRMAMVAVTEGVPFDFSQVVRPKRTERKLAEILDDVPLDSPMWSTMEGAKEREARVLEAGKNFKMQVFTAESAYTGTVTRGYARVRGTDPKVQHPTNPDLLRLFTPDEHARLKGYSPSLVAGVCKTVAHEMLGQSVLKGPFVALARAQARALLQWFSNLCKADVFELQAA